jgi:hypothetical protein
MKRCPVCDLLNLDDALSCTSCGKPLPRKKRGYFQAIRWHLLALVLVLGMIGLLKYRGGEIFRDFGRIMSSSFVGQVEISSVRIYRDLKGNTVVEGNLKNLSKTDFTDLNLEIVAYNGQDKKLGRHDYPIPILPKSEFTPFLVKLPSYEDVDHVHFTLREKNKKELYLINRAS